VYEREDFASRLPENIHVLLQAEPVQVGANCALYPCPQLSSYPVADPLDWIPARDREDRVRIAVLHGNLPSIAEISGEACPAFNPEKASAKGLDYTALGHWHGQVIDPGQRWAYPGTPEQCHFEEKGTGQVLIVSADGQEARPQVTPRRVGCLHWLCWDREVRSHLELESLRREIEALESQAQMLLRIRLHGRLRADELPGLRDLTVWLQARVANDQLLWAELTSHVHTAEALEGALRDLAAADPLVAQCVADLRRMVDPEGERPSCEGREASALDELAGLWAHLAPPENARMSEVASEALALLARRAVEVQP
jgi:hypothetical protein